MRNILKSHLSKVAVLGILVLAFQNCARIPLLGSFGSDSSKGPSAAELAMAADPVSSPYALLSGEQLLKGMMNVTGATFDNTIRDEFNSRSAVFGTTPDLKGTTAPMLIAVTSVGGAVCDKMLTLESAKAAGDRAFFGSFVFTTPVAAVTDAQFSTVVRSLARTFWGRNEDSTELASINQGKAEFIQNMDAAKKTQAVSTRDLALFTCAAMVSTVDAISY